MSIYGISGQTRVFGLASGLDVDDIVQGFMQVERVPLDRLHQKKQILQWQQDDLRQINRSLRELRDLAFNLQLQQTYSTRGVSSSNESILTVGVGANAALGTHTVTVHQLADHARFHSDGDLTAAGFSNTGKLADQFDFTHLPVDSNDSREISFTIINTKATGGVVKETFTFNVDTDSLRDVVNAINASDLELQATYEPDIDRFFLTSTNMGSDVELVFGEDDNQFLTQYLKLNDRDGSTLQTGDMTDLENFDFETFDPDDPTNPFQSYQGIEAIFDYNGATGLTRSSNQFSIGGVTYSLHQADPNNPVTVHVTHDTDQTFEKIKSFIEKYNEVITHINSKLGERRYYDYHPLTDAQREEMSEKEIERWEEQAKSGLLRGDMLLTGILNNLRRALGANVALDGNHEFSSLADIGITTGDWREQGILHVDEAKLRAALVNDAEGVAALFRQEGSTAEGQGVIRGTLSALDVGMEHITNRVGRAGAAADQSSIGRQIGWLDDEIERAERRLEQREIRLYQQFSVLETFVNQMNAQSMWMFETFGGGGY